MKIYYGKKRWVPKKCPRCGTPEAPEPKSFEDVFKLHYHSWLIGVDKDPFWRMPRWYGVCRMCTFMELLYTPREETWQYKAGLYDRKKMEYEPIPFLRSKK